MKIILIINKEELSGDDLASIGSDFFINKYEDIVSHDSYWVVQDAPGEINERIIHETLNSVYVFDRNKTGASGGCFRVDVYDRDLQNPNAIVNFFPLIKKGRWFDNRLINYNSEEDMSLIRSIVKHDDLKAQLLQKTFNYTQEPLLLKITENSKTNNVLPPEPFMQKKLRKANSLMHHRPAPKASTIIKFLFRRR